MRARADTRSMSSPPCAVAPSGPRRLHLWTDVGGATSVEYAVALTLVTLGASALVAVMGALLADYFAAQRAWLLLPFP